MQYQSSTLPEASLTRCELLRNIASSTSRVVQSRNSPTVTFPFERIFPPLNGDVRGEHRCPGDAAERRIACTTVCGVAQHRWRLPGGRGHHPLAETGLEPRLPETSAAICGMRYRIGCNIRLS